MFIYQSIEILISVLSHCNAPTTNNHMINQISSQVAPLPLEGFYL